MRAPPAQEADLALAISEEHEVLAEEPHGHGRPALRQFLGQRNRLPVAPHEVAGGRAGASPRQQFILLLRQHTVDLQMGHS